MRAERQRGHHGNAAQEKYDVHRIIVRHRAMEIDLIVRPLKLPDHPERATHGNQHPEKISSPVRSSGIQKKTGVGKERHNTLGQVSKSGKSMVPPWEKQRDARIND